MNEYYFLIIVGCQLRLVFQSSGELYPQRVHRVVKPCNSFLSFSRHYMHYIHVKQQQ